MIRRNADEIANEMRMRRSQFPGTFVVVEGRDDRLFLESFISFCRCTIEVATGKGNVCDVIEILDEDSFDGVLGIIDADFDRLEGIPTRSVNLLMPESHDLITMLVRSPALDGVLRELGSRRKIESFGQNVLDALISRALPVGYLRMYSIREGLGLKFNGLNYSAWIDRASFVANTDELIEEVKNHSQRHDLCSSTLAAAIDELNSINYCPYEICNGTDLVEILSLGLRSALGNNNPSAVTGEVLKRSLRLGYSRQMFGSSRLKKDIEGWEDAEPRFQVLQSYVT